MEDLDVKVCQEPSSQSARAEANGQPRCRGRCDRAGRCRGIVRRRWADAQLSGRAEITAMVARLRLPAMYGFRELADAGRLMSYGYRLPDAYRQSARLVVRISKATVRAICRSSGRPATSSSSIRPPVWSGRAVQEVSSTLGDAVLHQCTQACVAKDSLLSARKGHASPERFTHYVAVDEGRGFHGLLADLSGLQHSIVNPDSFVDPSILEVNWGRQLCEAFPLGVGDERLLVCELPLRHRPSPTPIPFGLPPHRWRVRVLALDPVC